MGLGGWGYGVGRMGIKVMEDGHMWVGRMGIRLERIGIWAWGG